MEAVIGKTAFVIETGDEVLVNDWQNQGVNHFYLIDSDYKVKLKKLIKKMLLMKTR